MWGKKKSGKRRKKVARVRPSSSSSTESPFSPDFLEKLAVRPLWTLSPSALLDCSLFSPEQFSITKPASIVPSHQSFSPLVILKLRPAGEFYYDALPVLADAVYCDSIRIFRDRSFAWSIKSYGGVGCFDFARRWRQKSVRILSETRCLRIMLPRLINKRETKTSLRISTIKFHSFGYWR